MKQFLLLTILTSAAGVLCGQYGGIDAGFDPMDDGLYGDGVMTQHASYSEPIGELYSLSLLDDGDLLIAGNIRAYNGGYGTGARRLNADGSLASQIPTLLPDGSYVMRALPEAGGTFLVAGTFEGGNGARRIGADGTLATDLQVITGYYDPSIALYADGRILINGGLNTSVNGIPVGPLARILPNGQPDATFFVGTGPNNRVNAYITDQDGAVIIGGAFTMVDGTPRKGLARLLPSGALDPDFDPLGGAGGSITVSALAMDAQGRLLVGGSFYAENTGWTGIARFLPNGDPDPDFAPALGAYGGVAAIAVLPDERIYIGGSFSTYQGEPRTSIARLFHDGTLDTGFEARLGQAYGPIVRAIVPLPGGDVIIGGRFSAVSGRFRMSIARLHESGAPVLSFNPGRGPGGLVRGMALMDDGRVAIAGEFISYNDEPRPHLAFLTGDGLLDPQFDGGEGPNGPVDHLVKLQDGRLFLAGRFSAYDGQPAPRMAVVDAFGALDATVAFSDGLIPLGHRFSAAVALPDGCVVIAAHPEMQPYGYTSLLFKLLPSGAVDDAFQPPAPVYGSVYCMRAEPDGRLLLGGSFQMGSLNGPRCLVRLLPNGGLDPSFSTQSGFGPASTAAVHAIARRQDGRLLIGGYFTSYRNAAAHSMVCIEPDGTRFTGYTPRAMTSMYDAHPPVVLSIATLPDDRAVVTGWFSSYDGSDQPGMMVVLPDGGHDSSFALPAGPEYVSIPYIHEVMVEPDGNYLVRGLFHRLGGVARHRLARVLGGGGVGFADRTRSAAVQAWPNPAVDVLHFSEPLSGTLFSLLGEKVRRIDRQSVVDLRGLPSGVYMLHAHDGRTARIVKQ